MRERYLFPFVYRLLIGDDKSSLPRRTSPQIVTRPYKNRQ